GAGPCAMPARGARPGAGAAPSSGRANGSREAFGRVITLKPGREGPVRAGHPWIFSGAIAAGLDGAEPGEPVRVVAANGRFLAAGYCNPRTPIAVRILTTDDEPVDAALVHRRLDQALALRGELLGPGLDT